LRKCAMFPKRPKPFRQKPNVPTLHRDRIREAVISLHPTKGSAHSFGCTKIEKSTTQLIPFHHEELVSVRSLCGLGNIRCDAIYESEFVDPGTQLVEDAPLGSGTDSPTNNRRDANHLPAVQGGESRPTRRAAEPKYSKLSCLRW